MLFTPHRLTHSSRPPGFFVCKLKKLSNTTKETADDEQDEAEDASADDGQATDAEVRPSGRAEAPLAAAALRKMDLTSEATVAEGELRLLCIPLELGWSSPSWSEQPI